MRPKVYIYELDGGCHTFEWLCEACAEKRRKLLNTFGHIQWTKVVLWTEVGGPPIAVDGDCADCSTAEQLASGYVTPMIEVAFGGGT